MITDTYKRVEHRLSVVGLTASAASKAAGLSEDAIRNMKRAAEDPETGRKGVSTRTISALAPVLRTTAGWLLDGDGPEEWEAVIHRVPLVGYVGAGAEAHFYGSADEGLGEVDAPEGATENTRAAEIRGESLGPLFERWLIFYDDVRTPVTPDLIGQLCIVGLPGDKVLVKKLQSSRTEGLYHLLSNNEAPMLDQEVLWAARVRQMTPR
jgi:hypothetical protein